MDQADNILFRWAAPSDFKVLGEVVFDAVRNGASPYSESQRKAWVAAPRDDAAWHEKLGSQHIIVAVEGESIAGFMSLADQGYVDFAFIRPSFQNSGLFRKLYSRIEKLALDEKQRKLWVHASLTAQPGFSAMGFQIVKSEEVQLGDQMLKRFEMEKLFD